MIGDSARFTVILLISSFLVSCVVKSPSQGAGTSPSLKIQDIRVAEGVEKTIVEIEGEGLMLFTSFQLSDPDRLILEISEVDLGKYRNEIVMSEGPIRSIIPIPMDNIFVSRLEFALSDNVKTDVRPEGLNIVVEVTQMGAGMDRMGVAQKVPVMGAEQGGMRDAPSMNEAKMEMEDIAMKGKADLPPPPLPTGDIPAVGTLPPPLPPAGIGSDIGTPDMMLPSLESKPDSVSAAAEDVTPKKEIKESSPSPIPSKSLGPAKKITAIRVVAGDSPQFSVKLDGLTTPNVFYPDSKKRRVVIDFPGVTSSAADRSLPGDGRFVAQVRTGKHPDKIRLVLDLIRPVDYSWEQRQGEFTLTLKANPLMQSFESLP